MGEQALASYTCSLDDAQAVALEAHLQEHGFELREVPYARFGGKRDKVNVVLYESGKLVVQGKGTREFVEFVLEPEILKEARLGYEAELSPEMRVARIGVDESGKGDCFGPLCIAGVYVNESVCRVLVEAGDGSGDLPFEDTVTITHSTTTATVSHTAHGMADGDKVVIRNADQNPYNGVFAITNSSANAYDYVMGSDPGTNATGTIDATGAVLEGLTNASGQISASAAYTVDQAVRGGVVARIGDTVFDGSVNTHLERLRQCLAG